MKLNKATSDLVEYLSAPAEKANEDLAISYLRYVFGKKFTRQKEAENSDGYVPGNLVLELKGNTSDWLSGLLQGLAYGRELDFTKVVVAAHEFLGIWFLSDLPEDISDEVYRAKGAPNAVGKKLAKKFKARKKELLNQASYLLDDSFLPHKKSLFSNDPSNLKHSLDRFKEVLKSSARKRQRVTLKNFTSILKKMQPYFDEKQPLAPVRAFYSIIFGWDEGSKVEISAKRADSVSVRGEPVLGLKSDKRQEFKRFVEDHYVSDDQASSKDVFFAHFDQALDAVDQDFRIKNGIFFTDLDLSRFAMWYVKRELGNIGDDYMVIDPACGSGNLVTNWRSPLELRHKVVSEIEPELLFAVERRMQGDEWHNGKFTVVPKVSEAKGLNFLDISAEEYVDILKSYLKEKGLKPDKPLAFLCNPPYRSDDDQAADSISYDVHPSIIDLIGKDASSERYCCFLAQMKLICEKAESSGLPDESLLLLFTKAAWLTNRPVFQKIRSEIFKGFEDLGGVIVNSKEFFNVKGKFPVAFTIWRYNESKKKLDPNRPANIIDLTWLQKKSLSEIDWEEEDEYSPVCEEILKDKRAIQVGFGVPRDNIKVWSGQTRKDVQRNWRKSENKNDPCGLPRGDERHNRKKRLGEMNGEYVAFLDDLTPFRIKQETEALPWFRLNNQFMDCRKTRCFSGPPDNRGFCAHDEYTAKKLFIWFALGRTFASESYPMWVDAMEMWGFDPKIDVLRMAYAIGFAENECVETIFPANNPVKGTSELYVANPMSPNSKSSFWSTTMKPVFDKGSSPAHDLVETVSRIYKKWKKELGADHQISVSYEKAYFIGNGKLSSNSGLIQIRDYAKEMGVQGLLNEFSTLQEQLSALKASFFEMLVDKNKLNYFGPPEISKDTKQPKTAMIEKSKFQKVLDLRMAMSARIVDELQEDPNFGRTKFAKVLYLAEHASEVDLDTNYYREAAGPLDQRALYNKKVGVESVAQKLGYFSTDNRKSPDQSSIRYRIGKNLKAASGELGELVASDIKSAEIARIIRLVRPMNTSQIEIVSTLYAAWNDLLLKNKGKKITDMQIINEFRDNWHDRKKRFSKDRLSRALKWMRDNDLVPKGKGKATQVKRNEMDF